MPIFHFKVSDASGNIEKVLIEANDQNDACKRIQARGLLPVNFLGEGGETNTIKSLFSFRKRLDVCDFTDRLVPLLEAGIELEKALQLLEESSDSDYEKTLIKELREGLHSGKSFSELIESRSHIFPKIYGSVVSAGEESGALPEVLSELRKFLQSNRKMKNFIISSSIYPLFVIAVCISVMILLLGVVVPRFATVITSTGKELSLGTDILLSLSTFMNEYWWAIPIAICLIILTSRYLWLQESFRVKLDYYLLRLPVSRRLVILSDIGRMSRTMSILINSGVHMLDTVRIGSRVVSNTVLRQSIANVGMDLRKGDKLSKSLSRSEYIPSLLIKMLSVGEETGASDEMLSRVADKYEAEFQESVKRLLSWFEPIIIITLGMVVGGIVLMLFLSILDMQSAI